MVELFSWRTFSMDLTQANHTTHKPPANVIFLRNLTTLNWNKNIQPCVIRLMKALTLLEFFLEAMVLFSMDAISMHWVSAMWWNYYVSFPPSHNFSGSYYTKNFMGIRNKEIMSSIVSPANNKVTTFCELLNFTKNQIPQP